MDCFRRLHPNRKDAFTCWNTQTGARENNYGTRIDFITASADFANRTLGACDIMPEFLGSDHCPVRAKFFLPLPPGGKKKSWVDSGEIADSTTSVGEMGGDDREWSEHPPECSCFYPELARKQAKLARYFVASGSDRTPPEDARKRENGVVGETGGGTHGSNLAPCFVNGRAGAVRRRTLLSQTKAGSKGPEPREMRGSSLAPAGRSSSCAAARRRGIGSTSRLQGKLTFGSAATRSSSIPAAKLRTVVSAAEGERKEAAGDVVRGFTNGGQGQAAISSVSSSAVNSSANAAEPSGRWDETQGSDVPLDGSGEGASAFSGTARTVGRVEPGPGSSSNSESAEAWKALFKQKKSAPICEHGEPSIQRTVLKAGPNQNRRFYTCARSAGNWPTDRNARCKFFQFRDDGVRGFMERPPHDDSSTKKQRRS